MNTKEKKVLSADNFMQLLDTCYQKAINGIEAVSPPIEVIAENYLSKHPSATLAAKDMIAKQSLKCATSGFLTGFGGFVTMPVSIPANVTSVLYVQLRMIACTAYMAGYDTKSDQVQTLVYACLAGISMNGVLKKFGIEFGEKVAVGAIKKIPGKVLTAINQKVGFRCVTKFGQKGLINLGKCVPVVGAAIGGGFDLAETKIIGARAYKWFFENDFSVESDASDVIDVDEFTVV